MFVMPSLSFLALNVLLAAATPRKNIKLQLDSTSDCLTVQDNIEGEKGESLGVFPCEVGSKWDVNAGDDGQITLSETSLAIKPVIQDGIYVKVVVDEATDETWNMTSDGRIRYITDDLAPWNGVKQCLGQRPALRSGSTLNVGLVNCTSGPIDDEAFGTSFDESLQSDRSFYTQV
ncbi:hypothetical protein I302_105510 [Kwoniella bestiolae CBS 10118]|uniref:Ricin B lectin domain-containing protein n=1 Tax=Kwoniella bestiolae CBS 10118 TaxID=1296100 RepID=A0A1B9FTC5_9TREE|nr:hypothetical protein I302_08791 [Kwoniella bestiolae CBS 10118]OCF22010.1 hypothetical protein I302_08791 [Kwoniella bestiolae CBS 10118]